MSSVLAGLPRNCESLIFQQKGHLGIFGFQVYYLYIHVWVYKFDHDLTVLPSPGIMVYFGEIIPFYGCKIQVSEIL